VRRVAEREVITAWTDPVSEETLDLPEVPGYTWVLFVGEPALCADTARGISDFVGWISRESDQGYSAIVRPKHPGFPHDRKNVRYAAASAEEAVNIVATNTLFGEANG
jgi:hypothetical protein